MSTVTVGSAWKSATVVDSNQLAKQVAELYGLDEDTEVVGGKATRKLDEAVKDLNTYTFEFNIVSASGLAITADDQEVNLPTQFYREKVAYLVNSSDSKSEEPLTYVDWAAFQRLYGINPRLGAGSPYPRAYSARNTHLEGTIFLGPTPSSSVASSYTLSIDYYRRIDLPSTTAQLTIPQEAENFLLYSAKRRFAEDIAGPDSRDIVTLKLLEDQALTRLRTIDRKHPDAHNRFRLNSGFKSRRINSVAKPVYIRVD